MFHMPRVLKVKISDQGKEFVNKVCIPLDVHSSYESELLYTRYTLRIYIQFILGLIEECRTSSIPFIECRFIPQLVLK